MWSCGARPALLASSCASTSRATTRRASPRASGKHLYAPVVGQWLTPKTACPLQAQGKFRWAMVARNKARLEGVHREMVNINSEMKARSNCATA